MGKHCDDPLHGITVVVDTAGPRLYIGRYHSETADGVVMLDVDVRDLDSVEEKPAYLARSAKMGVFRNTDSIRIPKAEITSIRRLIEYADQQP